MKVAVILLTLIALMTIPFNQNQEEHFTYTPEPYVVTTAEILDSVFSVPEPRTTILAAVIDDASVKEGVPKEYLIAVIKVESEFQWHLVSPKGAIGYSQIIPKYWKGHEKYNVYDQYENIYLSACILKEYYGTLGSWDEAFKAYNVGIGNFRKNKLLDAQKRYIVKINRQLDKIYRFQEKRIGEVAGL